MRKITTEGKKDGRNKTGKNKIKINFPLVLSLPAVLPLSVPYKLTSTCNWAFPCAILISGIPSAGWYFKKHF